MIEQRHDDFLWIISLSFWFRYDFLYLAVLAILTSICPDRDFISSIIRFLIGMVMIKICNSSWFIWIV